MTDYDPPTENYRTTDDYQGRDFMFRPKPRIIRVKEKDSKEEKA